METVQQVEAAVVQVCRSFHGIADRARQSVAQAAQCLEGPGRAVASAGTGSRALIATTHHPLERLLERVENVRRQSMKTAQKMDDIERGMKRVEKILLRIDSISNSTKILALNARIEAARAGAQGRAFAVVAGETSKVAAEAAGTGQAIREIVQQVSRDVSQISTDLRAAAASNEEEAKASQDEVGKAFHLLAATHEEMQRSVQSAVRGSEEVAEDVARAVVGLQFQDAVSQRVGHVVEALQEMEAILDSRLSPEDREQAAPAAQVWVEQLAARYTMAAERQAQEQEIGQAGRSGAELAGNIELF
jgi:methyl-accepting chemotaxis protein